MGAPARRLQPPTTTGSRDSPASSTPSRGPWHPLGITPAGAPPASPERPQVSPCSARAAVADGLGEGASGEPPMASPPLRVWAACRRLRQRAMWSGCRHAAGRSPRAECVRWKKRLRCRGTDCQTSRLTAAGKHTSKLASSGSSSSQPRRSTENRRTEPSACATAWPRAAAAASVDQTRPATERWVQWCRAAGGRTSAPSELVECAGAASGGGRRDRSSSGRAEDTALCT
eukprot:scaffold536_cov98-Isochrysis_galbana.AAC.4